MEKSKKTISNNEVNKTESNTNYKEGENVEKNESVSADNLNEEISQKEKIINDTLSNINDIRSKLGLDASSEIPPSVQQIQESLEKLNKEKSKLESSNLKIVEPIPEETSEEYISRSMKMIVENAIHNDFNTSNTPILIKKGYYGKASNSSISDFFYHKENTSQIKDLLLKLELNNNKKFSKEKNELVFDKLNKKIWNSSRDSASGDTDNKIDYYSNTNQARDFFSYGRKFDAHSYSAMMFGLPENFINTTEGKEYIHEKIDNKTIFLFGGGDSIKDLLKSEEFIPKKVVNFDPFVKEETIDKNTNRIYESQMISASDKKIREMIDKNEIPKADEVWATYSVPFYLDSSEDIKELITNMSSVLSEGGNARISPIAVQSIEKDGENFETRKQALVDSIKNLLDNPDYNVSVFNDTLKIHKIKKDSK